MRDAENEHKRAPAAEVDPDGMFERAYAEAAGVAHEASRPRVADPQTEARALLAGLIVAFNSDADRHTLTDRIATALAAKDAELAAANYAWRAMKDRAHAAEAQLAEARKALEPFALVAEHDIGEDEADSDTYRPMERFNRVPRITVGHLRAARRALTGGKS